MKYVFRCSEHGEFEVEQAMESEHKAICPKCGKPAERVFTPAPHIWEPYDHPHHEERRG